MADYFQVKNQNIFNPPANTSLGNATNQFDDVYVQNDLVLGNTTVTGSTINTPKVATITYPGNDTAADTAGGQTITLTGSGFLAGASVLINGSAVGVVSVVNSTTITFTSPANTTGSYVIYVINTDGGTAISIPGIQYSGTPTWTTAAGSLGNVYETVGFNQSVTATGDAPITYSVFTGSLPPGSTFNANGTITGTSQSTASPTTYSFTVRATDAEQQDTNRAFSISVIPDVVTWNSPANNTTYTQSANTALANITLSATSAAGFGIVYTANTLPTGVSINGANIVGTPTVIANSSSLLTATANSSGKTSTRVVNWVVESGAPQVEYLVVAGGGGGSGGGGGAGGMLTGTTTFSGSYTLTVGAGGAGNTQGSASATSGSNSLITGLTSIGGGGGGGVYAVTNGLNGGSGGGGSIGTSSTASVATGGTATSGQGYAGGTATNTGTYQGWIAGGGGGAGGVGESVTNRNTGTAPGGGLGGAGVASSITGSAVTYAAGGQAYWSNTVSGDATSNTGNGGGGSRTSEAVSAGWNGGSGVVIIAYPDTYPAISSIGGGLSYTQPSRAGYRVYRFTAGTGTITF